jgi:2'-5' RNA ligase
VLSHCVVAFPTFSTVDGEWIESLRRAHDPQWRLIRAHITLVFPLVADLDALVAQTTRAVAGHAPFDVTITAALAHRDHAASTSHLFLVPGEGGDQIRSLHEDLYGREFRHHLRADAPYLPHVTVGAGLDHGVCVDLASDLNRHALRLTGRIETVEIVSDGPAGVTTEAVRSLR